MSGHTPGPWAMEFAEAGGFYEIGPLLKSGEIDWSREVAATAGSGEEDVANARLLTAAPDLKEAALQGLALAYALDAVGRTIPEVAQFFPGLAACKALICAAIAKASGVAPPADEQEGR